MAGSRFTETVKRRLFVILYPSNSLSMAPRRASSGPCEPAAVAYPAESRDGRL